MIGAHFKGFVSSGVVFGYFEFIEDKYFMAVSILKGRGEADFMFVFPDFKLRQTLFELCLGLWFKKDE